MPTAPRRDTPDVAVLGAGFAGICAAIRLREAGFGSFTIYEKGDGVGGTWRDNTYPGAACDIPSHLYSYSFERRAGWPRRYSEQPDILAYLEGCVDRYGLRPHLRLATEITELHFDDGRGRWHLASRSGERFEADVVVSALGQLNRPEIPELPGLDTFEGTTFHSARWRHDHDLSGRRVAVIGNGASAVQFVPRIAEETAHLHVFQRTPNWVVPKRDRAYAARTKAMLHRVPGLELAYRRLIYWAFESRFAFFKRDRRAAGAFEKVAAGHLRQQVPDPGLRAHLVPDYPVGCKRVLISDDYYPALLRDDVELVTDPITEVEPGGVVTSDGTHRPVDTIIFATGFHSTEFLAPMEVRGLAGRELRDEWADGAEAHLGMAVSGFPNLFLLYGPNTNLGHNSILFMIECQVHYLLGCLEHLAVSQADWLDVEPEAQSRFNRSMRQALHRTVWEAGCRSWYRTESGKVTNNWPRYTVRYWLDTRRPRFADFHHGHASIRNLGGDGQMVPTTAQTS